MENQLKYLFENFLLVCYLIDEKNSFFFFKKQSKKDGWKLNSSTPIEKIQFDGPPWSKFSKPIVHCNGFLTQGVLFSIYSVLLNPPLLTKSRKNRSGLTFKQIGTSSSSNNHASYSWDWTLMIILIYVQTVSIFFLHF